MTPNKNVMGILLAAGMGSRFGGDKLLHPLNENIEIGLRSALNLQPHVNQMVCVVRPNDHALIELYEDNGFTVIKNPHHSQGLSTSIVAGIIASTESSYWMLTLADMPLIQARTYEQLTALIPQSNDSDTKSCIIRPRLNIASNQSSQTASNSQAGHPVIFPQAFKQQLLMLTGDNGAKALFKSHAQHVKWFDTSDQGTVLDIDTPQALATCNLPC